MRALLIAMIVLGSASACSGRRVGDPTRGETCQRVAPSSCMYATRCGAWAGTQSDCERVARYECCERDGTCGERTFVNSDRLETCLATVRGAACGSNPLASDACRTATGVTAPPLDGGAGTFVPPQDAGSPARLYLSCAGAMTCGGGEDCYVLSWEITDFACTRPCSGPDDTSCPGGHCVRLTTGPRGEPAMSGTPVCLESCSSDSDCTIRGWTCVMTTTGFHVCLPAGT